MAAIDLGTEILIDDGDKFGSIAVDWVAGGALLVLNALFYSAPDRRLRRAGTRGEPIHSRTRRKPCLSLNS